MSEIQTNSLITIKPLATSDARHLNVFLALNRKEFQRFFPITLGKNKTLKDSENYIRNKCEQLKLKTEFTFAIRSNNTLVGLIILKNLNWELKQGELAYCMDKNYQGRGWMTKAVKGITLYAFNELNLKTLEIIAYRENKASVRVAEKCGYTWKKTLLKGYTPRNEQSLDMELFTR